MINKDKFIAYLNYIGITNERHHARLYKYYQRCYNKMYRASQYIKVMSYLGYEEETIENIITYLTYPEERIKMDIEVSIYGDTWGKEFRKREKAKKEKIEKIDKKVSKVAENVICFLGGL